MDWDVQLITLYLFVCKHYEQNLIRQYIADDAQRLANIYYNTIHNINVKDYLRTFWPA